MLYSDEGEPSLVGRRLGVSRAVARRMSEAGFAPFLGRRLPRAVRRGRPAGCVRRPSPGGSRTSSYVADRRQTICPNPQCPRRARGVCRQETRTLDAFADALAAALADESFRAPERFGAPTAGVIGKGLWLTASREAWSGGTGRSWPPTMPTRSRSDWWLPAARSRRHGAPPLG